jgi:hypothetical protein
MPHEFASQDADSALALASSRELREPRERREPSAAQGEVPSWRDLYKHVGFLLGCYLAMCGVAFVFGLIVRLTRWILHSQLG